MMIKRIQGTTRELGKAQGYMGLPIRDCMLTTTVGGQTVIGPAMRSAWEPTPAEIEAIQRGEPIILTLMGTGHPPCLITVGDQTNDENNMSRVNGT